MTEKPPAELMHHGVKGMKWGTHKLRQLETSRLQKKSTKLQSQSDHFHRLADRKPANTKERLQRAAVDVGNLGVRKLSDAALKSSAAQIDAKHAKVLERLRTPEGQRRLKGSTKAKIAVGSVVAAHVLYQVGGLALGTAVAGRLGTPSGAGVKAIGATAAAVKYAKRSKGAFKITNL